MKAFNAAIPQGRGSVRVDGHNLQVSERHGIEPGFGGLFPEQHPMQRHPAQVPRRTLINAVHREQRRRGRPLSEEEQQAVIIYELTHIRPLG